MEKRFAPRDSRQVEEDREPGRGLGERVEGGEASLSKPPIREVLKRRSLDEGRLVHHIHSKRLSRQLGRTPTATSASQNAFNAGLDEQESVKPRLCRTPSGALRGQSGERQVM